MHHGHFCARWRFDITSPLLKTAYDMACDEPYSRAASDWFLGCSISATSATSSMTGGVTWCMLS